jgi:hypothetical protein
LRLIASALERQILVLTPDVPTRAVSMAARICSRLEVMA